jgi:AcrR family transcriptional regulator
MARRPARRSAGGRGGARPAEPQAGTQRDRIIDALLALVAEKGFAATTLADIAERSGVGLPALRAAYDGKLGILADFARRTDEAVLAGGAAEGGGPRDRLFDIFMRRLDLLAPHKAVLKRLAAAVRCDPLLACALARMGQRSQRWMHAAAGIESGGCASALAVRGGALVYADVMRVWLDDDDPGLARTMKRLDEGLQRGERAMRFVSDLCGILPSFLRAGPRRSTEARAGG